MIGFYRGTILIGAMGAMGRLVLGLVLGLVLELVLAYCVTRFSFSLLKGAGLEMKLDWIGTGLDSFAGYLDGETTG